MTRKILLAAIAAIALGTAGGASTAAVAAPSPLPPGFVYLSDVAPSIVQDVRYYGYHNFIGRPIVGYDAPVCILTNQAAQALAKVQIELEKAGLTLRVYDCYRPQRSVNEFIAWSKVISDQRMKPEFYPRVDKAQFFALGYVAAKSGHTRGSSVDLSIERLGTPSPRPYVPGKYTCIAPFAQRYHDGTIDMGTSFDCMDKLSHPDADIGEIAYSHRMLLRSVMEKYGFKGIKEEWWHFTLRWEPYPNTYFDFPIVSR